MQDLAFTLDIPIRPYLKKFIAAYDCVDPFLLKNTKCHFSSLILEPLEREYHKEVKNFEKRLLTEILSVRISSSLMNQKKYFLSVNSILFIDSRLNALFKQQMCDFITMSNKRIGDIQASIEQFKEFYKITEDELPLLTVCKIYQRETSPIPVRKDVAVLANSTVKKTEKFVQISMFE